MIARTGNGIVVARVRCLHVAVLVRLRTNGSRRLQSLLSRESSRRHLEPQVHVLRHRHRTMTMMKLGPSLSLPLPRSARAGRTRSSMVVSCCVVKVAQWLRS